MRLGIIYRVNEETLAPWGVGRSESLVAADA